MINEKELALYSESRWPYGIVRGNNYDDAASQMNSHPLTFEETWRAQVHREAMQLEPITLGTNAFAAQYTRDRFVIRYYPKLGRKTPSEKIFAIDWPLETHLWPFFLPSAKGTIGTPFRCEGMYPIVLCGTTHIEFITEREEVQLLYHD